MACFRLVSFFFFPSSVASSSWSLSDSPATAPPMKAHLYLLNHTLTKLAEFLQHHGKHHQSLGVQGQLSSQGQGYSQMLNVRGLYTKYEKFYFAHFKNRRQG